jgi:hypothetical protein
MNNWSDPKLWVQLRKTQLQRRRRAINAGEWSEVEESEWQQKETLRADDRLLALKTYPRVCRRGHTIDSPHGLRGEHVGAHRQCKVCRLESQKRANERYDYPDAESAARRLSSGRHPDFVRTDPADDAFRLASIRRFRKMISANNINLAQIERQYAAWQQDVRARYGDEVWESLHTTDEELTDGLFSDVRAVTSSKTPSLRKSKTVVTDPEAKTESTR